MLVYIHIDISIWLNNIFGYDIYWSKGGLGKVMFVIRDEIEEAFREAIRNKYRGRETGMLSYSVEEAIELWLERERQNKENTR
jgi:hypothetical protein